MIPTLLSLLTLPGGPLYVRPAPVTVYVDSATSKQFPKKEVFYAWVGDADSYKIVNTNPAIRVTNYPHISCVYITGTTLLPVETRNSYANWVPRSRVARITIDTDRILVEVPKDIPVEILSRH